MPKEIERKFLIKNNSWLNQVDSKIQIKQGYLNEDPSRSVRIRIKNNKGILSVKGKSIGFTRLEYEYEIPISDAEELLKLCNQPIIEKTRYIVLKENLKWEIDIFEGENSGLQMAEVELESEDQKIAFPEWLDKEVTHDKRYYNLSLMKSPYNQWK